MISYDYIAHYGMPRRSGRYPWGSGDRPYQDRETRKSFRQRRKENKAAKKRAETLRKQREEQKALEEKRIRDTQRAKELQERKAEALLSDPASKILKDYKGKLTNSELDYVVKRLQFENTLSAYSEREVKSGKDKIREMVETGKLVVDVSRTGIDLWNTMAVIYNSSDYGKNNPLSYISVPSGGGGGKKKK